MINKIKKYFRDNYLLYIILIVYLFLMLLSYKELGINYSLNSDDISYINSGIAFAKNHTVTLLGETTAQIMPGMTYLIGGVSMIFGSGSLFLTILKIIWLIMGAGAIIYLYKIVRIYTNQYIAIIPTIFLLTPDYIWTNNLILTETPFILLLLMLFYYSIKLASEHKTHYYIMIIISYICCLFIRPNIALYPLFLLIYLIWKKYDLKLLFKQLIIAGIAVLLCLAPWIYRNYQVFNKFIPLTYGMGNPLLLGTYQGVGYPSDEELDYENDIYKPLSQEMKYYLENPQATGKWKKYYSLQYDEIKAKYRMKTWWEKDKLSMLKSYLYYKPKIMLVSSFYWKSIFGINDNLILLLRKGELLVFIFFLGYLIFKKKHFSELFLLLGIYGYNIILYCYSFAFGRYATTLFPIRYIIIGIGLAYLYNNLKENGQTKISK